MIRRHQTVFTNDPAERIHPYWGPVLEIPVHAASVKSVPYSSEHEKSSCSEAWSETGRWITNHQEPRRCRVPAGAIVQAITIGCLLRDRCAPQDSARCRRPSNPSHDAWQTRHVVRNLNNCSASGSHYCGKGRFLVRGSFP